MERTGVPSLSFAEHRADQPVEQVDGLIRQASRDIERGGDQRRVPALPLIFGDMLDRGAARLAGKLGQTSLMNEMPTPRARGRWRAHAQAV